VQNECRRTLIPNIQLEKDIIGNIGIVRINLTEFMCCYEAKIARNANNSFKQRILTIFNTYG